MQGEKSAVLFLGSPELKFFSDKVWTQKCSISSPRPITEIITGLANLGNRWGKIIEMACMEKRGGGTYYSEPRWPLASHMSDFDRMGATMYSPINQNASWVNVERFVIHQWTCGIVSRFELKTHNIRYIQSHHKHKTQ